MIYIYIYIYTYMHTNKLSVTHPMLFFCTHTHTHTHTHLVTTVLPLFEEPLEVLLVFVVGLAVALCRISRIGDKGI